MADAKGEVVGFVEPNNTKEKSERKSGTKTLLLYIIAGGLILAILGLVLGLSFGLLSQTETDETGPNESKQTATEPTATVPTETVPTKAVNLQKSRCKAGKEFLKFSVASDTSACSEIGCSILEKKGSAVDAAIAAMFCITVVTMHSSGIGGGNFMLIYEKQTRKAVFINAREKAPLAAHEEMYVNKSKDAKLGPMSAGVPGEVKGFIKAHEMFGKLEWRDLVEPSIKLASEGFFVTSALAEAIQRSKSQIKDPDFLKLLKNKDGNFKKEGDKIVNPKLAETLREIRDDPESFYSGELAKKIAADFKNSGGIITEEDLRKYDVGVTENVLKLNLDKITMLSCPLPSGGPVVTQIMNILQNFKFDRKSIESVESKILTYHRIVEAMKFAYARRPYFGDPDFVSDPKLKQVLKKVLNVRYNKELFKKIWDNTTHNNPSYYERFNETVRDEGSTSHLSVIAANGDTVSVTGSVNYYFGGKFRSKETGIIYNNEMDDFSIPGKANGFGYQPSRNNFAQPGKRPLSSMSPTIFVDKRTGDVRLAIGAAGGSKIISSTAWVSMLHLWMGLSLEKAVATPRLHHQFIPNTITINEQKQFKINKDIQKGLEKKGHVFREISGKSVVQAAAYSREEGAVFGESDPRKGGEAWGL